MGRRVLLAMALSMVLMIVGITPASATSFGRPHYDVYQLRYSSNTGTVPSNLFYTLIDEPSPDDTDFLRGGGTYGEYRAAFSPVTELHDPVIRIRARAQIPGTAYTLTTTLSHADGENSEENPYPHFVPRAPTPIQSFTDTVTSTEWTTFTYHADAPLPYGHPWIRVEHTRTAGTGPINISWIELETSPSTEPTPTAPAQPTPTSSPTSTPPLTPDPEQFARPDSDINDVAYGNSSSTGAGPLWSYVQGGDTSFIRAGQATGFYEGTFSDITVFDETTLRVRARAATTGTSFDLTTTIRHNGTQVASFTDTVSSVNYTTFTHPLGALPGGAALTFRIAHSRTAGTGLINVSQIEIEKPRRWVPGPTPTPTPTQTTAPTPTPTPTPEGPPATPTISLQYFPETPQIVTIHFSSVTNGVTFVCGLDTTELVPCLNPRSYSDIPLGPHTFFVEAVTSTGVHSETATRTWEVAPYVDPPNVSMQGNSDSFTTSRTVNIGFFVNHPFPIDRVEIYSGVGWGGTRTLTDTIPGAGITGGTAVRWSMTGEPGNTYCMSVIAYDIFGTHNNGGEIFCRAVPADDRSSRVSYSGDVETLAAGPAFQGSLTVLDGPGEEASFSFTGRRFAVMVRRGTTSGFAQILVDGVAQGSVDTYGSFQRDTQYIWHQQVGNAPHTVTIRWTGTRNAASTGSAIFLDGIGAIENAPGVVFEARGPI